MTQEHFDAIVVGAGPSGNAAAYTLGKAGLNVLQLERGEYPGSKNVQGAILYSDALEKLIPEFREEAPLERHVLEQRLWMLSETSHMGVHYRSEDFNEERPNRYTIIRAQFDKWFSGKVREAGVALLCETTALELLRDERGKVIGVRTDRENGDVYADVVILADGVNGLVGQRSGLRSELKPESVALAVKEMHFLPEEVIQSRFNIKGEEGVVIEAMGSVTSGMLGMGFIYTNRESISIGIGCLVSDFAESGISPNEVLERFKTHPSVAALLEGSEAKEYSGHLIPEGGYKEMPELYGDGWMVVGDSGYFINSLHREGSNMAMTSGQLAAETVIELKERGVACSKSALGAYRKKLNDSYVMKDLKKYKNLPNFMHKNRQLMDTYPALMGQAADTWFRVDGVDKKTKENQIFRSFLKARSIPGLLGDAFNLARAWR